MPQAQQNSSNYTIPRMKKKRKDPANYGECNFDGTDYPEWLGFDPKQPGSSFRNPFPTIDGDPWEKTMRIVEEHDGQMYVAWNIQIQNLLVFSALFSAVVTVFAVETQKLLQADPDKAAVLLLAQLAGQLAVNANITESISGPFRNPNSSSQNFRVNVFVFTSLVLSLGTALVGIVILQWLSSYRSSESRYDKERLMLRQIRYSALVKWKIPTIISYLPLLLGLALLIFFVGLIDFLDIMNSNVAIIIGIIVGLLSLFLLITTILPTVHIYMSSDPMPPCPYQSPQSWLCYKFFDGIFVWGNKRTSYCKNWTELILDLHKKSIILDPQNGDKWLKNALVWIFTKFNSPYSFRLAYHCLQSIDDMNVGWDVVSEVIGYLKDTGEDIWKNIQSVLSPAACTEFISTLLLLWNCPPDPKYTLHRSELFYRCVQTFSQFNTGQKTWPEYKKLIQLWWSRTGSISSNRMTSTLEDQRAYLATFLIALESNPVVGQENFNLFWKFLALQIQEGDSVPTVLDCLRILTRWLLRVEQLPLNEYRSWDSSYVLRYTLGGIFDYDVFNPSFVTPALYTHPTFTAFLDTFCDPRNRRLKEGWKDTLQASWPEKWDNFLLETGISRKYWELSVDQIKLQQRYNEMMGTGGQDSVGPVDPPRRQTVYSNITSSPEQNGGSSPSSVIDINDNHSSSNILTDVRTDIPTDVLPLQCPLPYTLSTASSPHLPGQTSTPGTSPNDEFTGLPRLSLEMDSTAPAEGGTATPPSTGVER